eukprot:CAMPEP_0116118618 /NCGR_PEP_ID=MMETSP0329-20121206/2203_1 /TAXON_ID=697910 /ORGANISM="Pseudo-nitzschia arenysensis, Strain B593" /LENGTH=740 /DNA_ID=CAMNT_0003612263 /DNA_START=258 /DNA_END=2480 /DNA_ORIENTATION=+
MASQDNDSARKRKGDFLDEVRKKLNAIPQPVHDKGRTLLEELKENEDALQTLIKSGIGGKGASTALIEILPVSKNWSNSEGLEEALEIVKQVRRFHADKDKIWDQVIGGEMKMNGSDSVLAHFKSQGFCNPAAAWTTNPVIGFTTNRGRTSTTSTQKIPAYTAFSGASGSGKTSAMLWTVHQLETENKLPLSCLKFYLSCNVPDSEELLGYVSNCVKNHLNERVRERTSGVLGFDNFVAQREKTTLVLVLDEVQSRFDHNTYKLLPGNLKNALQFQEVVLLVGSTALSQDVMRQPTGGGEVLNIRMKPLQEGTMPELLFHHLCRLQPKIQNIVGLKVQLFEEIPVLYDLMSNHRCAYFTAVVLTELLGEIPMEFLPDGWGVGHSATLVSMVACKYRASNGLKHKTQSDCQTIMLESLALVAGQKVIKANEGVDKNPSEGSLALLSKAVIEVGLVERAILPDEKLPNQEDKVKVDGYYEFEMSPALTLICVTSIIPWIGGISNAADHFEALVATLMVVMRYAQTNDIFHVRRLAQAVPYSGSDDHLYYYPTIPIDQKCFINGPQAPYSDLVVAGVPERNKIPDAASNLAKGIADAGGVNEFPVGPILVQCKLTTTTTANFTTKNELAKMGFVFVNEQWTSPDPADAGFPKDSRQYKQYRSGRWLTNHWVRKKTVNEQIAVVFATNCKFQAGTNDESLGRITMIEANGDHDYAWQKLYPIILLVRGETGKHVNEIERVGVQI